MNRTDAISLIFEALESLNRERRSDEQIPIAETTELLSDSSMLDSLAFVSFTSDLEDRLNSKTGKDLSLVDSALSSDSEALRTVSALAEHIVSEVNT